jgi:hypothetical protein
MIDLPGRPAPLPGPNQAITLGPRRLDIAIEAAAHPAALRAQVGRFAVTVIA